jgi:hypothetical protein
MKWFCAVLYRQLLQRVRSAVSGLTDYIFMVTAGSLPELLESSFHVKCI